MRRLLLLMIFAMGALVTQAQQQPIIGRFQITNTSKLSVPVSGSTSIAFNLLLVKDPSVLAPDLVIRLYVQPFQPFGTDPVKIFESTTVIKNSDWTNSGFQFQFASTFSITQAQMNNGPGKIYAQIELPASADWMHPVSGSTNDYEVMIANAPPASSPPGVTINNNIHYSGTTISGPVLFNPDPIIGDQVTVSGISGLTLV
jgi:hypothetical protein